MLNLIPNIYAHYKMNDNANNPFIANGSNTVTDLVVNGTCDTDTTWVAAMYAFYDLNDCYYIDDVAPIITPILYQSIASLANGTTYRLYYVCGAYSGVFNGQCTPSIGGTNGTTVTAAGTYIEDIVCGATDTNLKFTSVSGARQTHILDNIFLYKTSDYPYTGHIVLSADYGSGCYSSSYDAAGVINSCQTMWTGASGSPFIVNVNTDFAEFSEDDFTVTAWIWHDVTSSDCVFCRGLPDFSDKAYYLLVNSSNKLYFVSIDTVSSSDVTYSVESVATGEWEHIAVVREGTDVRLYLNGTECTYTVDGTHTEPWDNTVGVHNFYIGALGSTSTSSRWDGKIDDFRIYDRVLTLAEIQWIYNSNVGTESQSTIPIIHHLKQAGGL